MPTSQVGCLAQQYPPTPW